MMRLKVDENLPAAVAERLRTAGHDALTVLDQRMGGGLDAALAEACRTEGRAILTLDLDFADIRAYPPVHYASLIVLRLHHQDTPLVLEVVDRIIPMLSTEPVTGHLWIVDEQAVRIRGPEA